MEGSPYRKSSNSWKGGRSLGLVPRFFLAGTWSVPLSGTRGPGFCPEAGGNDTRVFFPNTNYKGRGEIIILKGAYELDQVSKDLRSWPTLTKSGTTTVARPQNQNGYET